MKKFEPRTHLLGQLTKQDDTLPFSPMVKNIKPYKNHESFIKNTEINLDEVDPRKLKFWSDPHFGHQNIIKYSDRPFNTAAEMDVRMINNYVNGVKEDDIVIWVGDVAMRNPTRINDEILSLLPGYKILIRGNHDFDYHDKTPIQYNFDEIHLIKTVRNFAISHHPWWDIPTGWFQIHGHIHNKKTENPRHINVSVEHLNYTPKSFQDILDEKGL
jgi:calcineurin-like phosphoesterase family protein